MLDSDVASDSGAPKAADSATTTALNASGAIAPGRHHIHFSYVILNALRVCLAIVVIVPATFLSALPAIAESNPRLLQTIWPIVAIIALVFLVVLFAIVALISYIYYRRFLWEIGDTDIHIYSGIIIKKQTHVPFRRVQSIDFNAGLLERVLGVVRLKIETAGGASNKAALIPALKLNEAEALRAEVFSRKQYIAGLDQWHAEQRKQANASNNVAVSANMGSSVSVAQPQPVAAVLPQPRFDSQTGAPLPMSGDFSSKTANTADEFVSDFGDFTSSQRGIFAQTYEENAPVEYEYGLSAKELVFASLSGDHNIVFFLIAIVCFVASLFVPDAVLAFVPTLSPIDARALEQILHLGVGWGTALGVGLFVVVVISSLLSTAFSYGAFKARRRGGRVEVERGLIQRQYKGVALMRVQSLVIHQGFVRRIMGYAEIRLLTVDTQE